jgi:hypothetical protein
VVLNDDDKPMVSTSIREATIDTPIHVLDRGTEDPSRVKFLLGKFLLPCF